MDDLAHLLAVSNHPATGRIVRIGASLAVGPAAVRRASDPASHDDEVVPVVELDRRHAGIDRDRLAPSS